MCQELNGEEVFQVLVVCDNIYWKSRAFQVVMLGGEHLKDCQELLIVSVIVQLHSSKGVGVKSDGVDLIVRASDGEDGSNSIVGGIGLYHNRSIRNPVNEHQHGGKHILQVKEGLPTIIGEVPRNSFSGEVGERDHNIQVVLDEPAVKIGKAKEGLNVLDFLRFRPLKNCLDFVAGHREPGQGKDIPEVFSSLQVPFAFLWLEI